jgi:hypothetical protein
MRDAPVANAINDRELAEVRSLVIRGRSVPAVVVGAIIMRLEAAEAAMRRLEAEKSKESSQHAEVPR